MAQHFGSRVENDLRKIGFNVLLYPQGNGWIFRKNKNNDFKNERQDSALLLELSDEYNQKSLILNLNDSRLVWGEVASISKNYKNSFYLRLHCWGDADMINLLMQ